MRARCGSAVIVTTRSACTQGLADTSLALAVNPGLVRMDQLRADAKPAPATGVNGDPRRASAELGRVGVDLIVAETVAAIRKSMARP